MRFEHANEKHRRSPGISLHDASRIAPPASDEPNGGYFGVWLQSLCLRMLGVQTGLLSATLASEAIVFSTRLSKSWARIGLVM